MLKIIKKLFKKKSEFERMRDFLIKELTPIAKYVYYGRLYVDFCPVNVAGQYLVIQVFFYDDNSKQIAKWDLNIEDVIGWMKERRRKLLKFGGK